MSQDREIMACRASGISEIVLLRPALMLGGAVTIVTLMMTNFISPRMARNSEVILLQNVKKMIFHKIRTEGHYKFPHDNNVVIHASHVENDTLYGVVVGRTKVSRAKSGEFRREVEHWMASGATVDIRREDDTGKYFVAFNAEDPVGPLTDTASGSRAIAEEFPFARGYPISRLKEEELNCFDWYELTDTLENPTSYGGIREDVEEIKEDIRARRLVEDVAQTLRRGQPYTAFVDDQTGHRLFITSPKVSAAGSKVVLASVRSPEGVNRRVEVREQFFDIERIHKADSGAITVYTATESQDMRVTVHLEGNIRTREKGKDVRQHVQLEFEGPIPEDPEIQEADIETVYNNPQKFTHYKPILAKIDNLKIYEVAKLQGKILAQLHFRNAYGFSCILLVSLGAALALLFKSSHFLLSTFVLTVIPMFGVFSLMIMGKKLVSNPDSPTFAGICCIWSGLVAVFVVDLVLYWRLHRR
jgi:lipopolysaccharide export LptBFGC system permease protein LptF